MLVRKNGSTCGYHKLKLPILRLIFKERGRNGSWKMHDHRADASISSFLRVATVHQGLYVGRHVQDEAGEVRSFKYFNLL